jgi:hypothetical protein
MNLKQLVFILLTFSFVGISCQKEDMPVYDYRKLGTASKDILSDQNYTSLEIQINYMPGYAPADTVINHFKNYLTQLVRKPVGVNLQPRLVTPTVNSPITLNELVALEKTIRTSFTRSQVLSIHIMILDAEYQTSDILGISYWNTSMCVFGRTVGKFSGRPGLVSKNQLMITLLEHEMGHLLGLVDQGTPMVSSHKSSNGAHCNNSSCLMNYIIETNSVGNVTIPVLDDNCRADLKANGGK